MTLFQFNTEYLPLLQCPVSGSCLNLIDKNTLVSEKGSHKYPVVHGIPDFRLFDPPYLDRKQEQYVTERLVKAAEHKNYKELVIYLESELVKTDSKQKTAAGIHHRLSLIHRAPERFRHLLIRAENLSVMPKSRVLDLGCGSGEASKALFEAGAQQVVGLDISLVELVLAKKLLSEQGIENILLLAGCAEALPLHNNFFDFVYSPDVIEHVTDQHQYLIEIHRTLKKLGCVLLNSPNRFSVVCPEPHVGIWGLTFLPRPLIDPVCRFLGKGAYTGKRLISYKELKSLLNSVFTDFSIEGRRANPQSASFAGRLYHTLSPYSEKVFTYVCDQHVVCARKV